MTYLLGLFLPKLSAEAINALAKLAYLALVLLSVGALYLKGRHDEARTIELETTRVRLEQAKRIAVARHKLDEAEAETAASDAAIERANDEFVEKWEAESWGVDPDLAVVIDREWMRQLNQLK